MKAEFFLDKTGSVKRELYFKIGEKGEWLKFDKMNDLEIESIFDVLKKHTKAWQGLMHLTRNLNLDGSVAQRKRGILKQFIHCNWTSMDRHWDISHRRLRFENVACPFKVSGNCTFSGKGIVCIKHEKQTK